MSCYICGKAVEPIIYPDSHEYPCPDCGHYRITGTAMALHDKNNWKFDVESTRRWLASQQGSGKIPMIDSNRAASLI